MKKSLIALIVAAALPAVAQADATLSGSVTVKISGNSKLDTDASLKISAEEQLTNGMTAKGEFEIMASDGNRGMASLSGDFGTLTGGDIDSDGAFQMGDVAELVDNTLNSSNSDTKVQGFHIETALGDLQLQAQRNGATLADGSSTSSTGTVAVEKGTQVGVTYTLNGITFGAAYANAPADANAAKGGITGAEGTNAYGMTYNFGDVVLKAGREKGKKAQAAATYTANMEAITVEATVKGGNTNGHKVVGTYTLDSLVVKATAEKGKDLTYGATYVTGDLTFDALIDPNADGKDKISAAMDMGNADLTLAVEDGTTSNKVTSLTYKVAF